MRGHIVYSRFPFFTDMDKIELLAPAGSFETLKAAIAAGADAVYIGGERFGARAFADNPQGDELVAAIEYAHLRGRKVYLTVNTLLKEREVEKELYDFLLPLYVAGVDAVIVQDLGVMQYISRHFPGLPIHASTQMTVTGVYGAKLLEECGVSRVIPARELSLEELRAIRRKTSLEIEVFVHGALCYCYSGQCLFSSMIGGRSGNRGRCAQPCRLPYRVFDGDKEVNSKKTAYVLSPRDMCAIRLLPEIIESGVCSLKIEGRMKKPEYTAGVVSVYRKYLDRYLAGKSTEVSRKDEEILLDLYNRDGFHESYFKQHNGRRMMAMENKKASDKAKARNEKLFAWIRGEYMEKELQVPAEARLVVRQGKPVKLVLSAGGKSVELTGPVAEPARSQPLGHKQLEKRVNKTGKTDFVVVKREVDMKKEIFLPIKEVNQLRRDCVEALREALLSPYRRSIPERSAEERAQAENQRIHWDGFSVLVSTMEQFKTVVECEYPVNRIYVELSLYREDSSVCRKLMRGRKTEYYLALPHVLHRQYVNDLRQEAAGYLADGFKGFLARNLEEYALLRRLSMEKKTWLDYSVYTMNREAQDFFRGKGAAGMTAPVELNQKELDELDNHDVEMIIYGYQVLMVSAQCTRKNTAFCDRKKAVLTLKDRKNAQFTVQCHCDFCYNLLYNSLPLGLLKERDETAQLGFCGARLQFTLEDAKETRSVLKMFAKAYGDKRVVQQGRIFTHGHFKRGVE